jgi:hypothetical protein
MILLNDGVFDVKEEVPSTRFWLMAKLRIGDQFDKRWDIYVDNIRKRLMENMTYNGPDIAPSEVTKAKKEMVDQILIKLENSAWKTMPAEFLKQLDIPRVIRK